MQTQEQAVYTFCSGQEKEQELIGVLTAISIVSKRLAGRLAALEKQHEKKLKGGSSYDTRKSAATR